MNPKLALVLVVCLFGALLLTAAKPVPEYPLHSFTGTISCSVTDEGTSDTKETVKETNYGQKKSCVIKADDPMVTGMMTIENLWSAFNLKQNGTGVGKQEVSLKTAEGTWKGTQMVRVNKNGVMSVNGRAQGVSGPNDGLKMWYTVDDKGVITGWCSEKPAD